MTKKEMQTLHHCKEELLHLNAAAKYRSLADQYPKNRIVRGPVLRAARIHDALAKDHAKESQALASQDREAFENGPTWLVYVQDKAKRLIGDRAAYEAVYREWKEL